VLQSKEKIHLEIIKSVWIFVKIGEIIGQGTFGQVRLATHILTDEKVAVKTLQKDKIVEQSDIERVTREICILKILRHPNIIQLYEVTLTNLDYWN
jgi:5'-AMP-activated protein kinase catalytic alpha subunit